MGQKTGTGGSGIRKLGFVEKLLTSYGFIQVIDDQQQEQQQQQQQHHQSQSKFVLHFIQYHHRILITKEKDARLWDAPIFWWF